MPSCLARFSKNDVVGQSRLSCNPSCFNGGSTRCARPGPWTRCPANSRGAGYLGSCSSRGRGNLTGARCADGCILDDEILHNGRIKVAYIPRSAFLSNSLNIPSNHHVHSVCRFSQWLCIQPHPNFAATLCQLNPTTCFQRATPWFCPRCTAYQCKCRR